MISKKKLLFYNLRHFFRVSHTFQKAKRRVEDKFNKIRFGKGKKKESMEEMPGSCKYKLLKKNIFNVNNYIKFQLPLFGRFQ